jgi:cell division protein FtsB
MTITTPPRETRTGRPPRTADEAATPARRRPPAERRAGAVEGRPAVRRTTRTGAAGSGAPATTTKPGGRVTATKAPKAAKDSKATVVRRSAPPPRAPFVLLVVGLLAGALVSLLLLNTVLAQDAFTLSELQRGNQRLSERKQALQEEISRESSPAVLYKKARALGMVDAKRPAFIDERTGRVTEGGTRPPGVSDDAMAAAAGAGVTGAPGAIMPPPDGTRAHGGASSRAGAPQRDTPRDGGTGGGTR